MEILNHKLNKSVVTLGKFDCLHLGHKKLIDCAKDIAKKEAVPLVAYTFGNISRENVFSMEERMSMFEEYGCDYVYVQEFDEQFKNLSPEEFFDKYLVGELGAVHVVTGYDWRFGKDRAGDVNLLAKLCEKANIGLTVIEKLSVSGREISATYIKSLLCDGDVFSVNKILGKNYFIKGNVMYGKKLGRKLGFPTINLILRDGFVYPKDGVYITRTYHKDICYPSITNIGDNPTVEDRIKKCETHILNRSVDLYGEDVTIEFLDFIRPEIKFENITMLKEQIEHDKAKAEKFFEKIGK